jgi:nucleoside 2-deoxyribosyltransferase
MTLYYVAHRLFAAHDRAVGAHVASQLAQAIGPDSIFLPFCDTDEENLVSDSKGRLLFNLDCARLRRITGMIALLHGPSLDDGVCMEIGFAAATRVPVVIVSTDFQTYAPALNGPQFAFPDPLFDYVAARIIRTHRLGAPREGQADRFLVFLDQNVTPIRAAASEAVSALLRLAAEQKSTAGTTATRHRDLAYIEPSPYLDDKMWDAISSELRARGWRVHVARRFLPGGNPADAARSDWAAATTASLAVVDARGPETPPGAAMVIGACTAAGRPVLAARTGTWHTLADGREPNWRNLMIQYAVTASFSGLSQFNAALDALACLPA